MINMIPDKFQMRTGTCRNLRNTAYANNREVGAMKYLLLIVVLLLMLFASGCHFTMGFSRAAPHTKVCNVYPAYNVTHYRPAYVDGGQLPPNCGSADCARPGYCCPGGQCEDSL